MTSSRMEEMVEFVAGRVADADEIRSARQFPYQYLAAYLNADDGLPQTIKEALGAAAEIACGNVPELPGPVVIGLDVSGSMEFAGHGPPRPRRNEQDSLRRRGGAVRGGHPAPQPGQRCHSVRYVRVCDDGRGKESILEPGGAAGEVRRRRHELFAAVARGDQRFRDQTVRRLRAGQRQRKLDRRRPPRFDGGDDGVAGLRATTRRGCRRHRRPKLVCIDLQPYATTQAPERADILNVGGFSDAVFGVVSGFLSGDASRFVKEVEMIEV